MVFIFSMISFIGVVFGSLCRILFLDGLIILTIFEFFHALVPALLLELIPVSWFLEYALMLPVRQLLERNLIPFYLSFWTPSAGFAGLFITTECGRLKVSPGEIAILPQGFRFTVDLPDGPSRGYVAEIFGTHFQLPDLGPIGIFSLL